ncbi:MAG: acyl-CoA thioesterase [Lewinellaceae bacterium]|nr:acyl-CoA thioesterase [Saprospiraceae bacterium]MCB9336567.1 acyl-CoA thioesterase [Lewinellaceae bacterium]
MYQHETQKRVRYGETDQMGYLYYGRYADLYEIGRVEMLRSLGLAYRDMEEKERIMMPVASMEMRFVRPAKYDEMLTIRTILPQLPTKDIVFQVEVFNENRKLVNAGTVRLAFVDMTTKKTIPAPDFLLEKLTPFF